MPFGLFLRLAIRMPEKSHSQIAVNHDLAESKTGTAWQAGSVVILQSQVCNQVLAHDVAQRVLQLHRLDEQVVLWIQSIGSLRRLEIEAQPLLYAFGTQFGCAFSQVEEQHQERRVGKE